MNKIRFLVLLLTICLAIPTFVSCDKGEPTTDFESPTTIPMIITADRMDEMIFDPIYERFGDELFNRQNTGEVADIRKFFSYYTLYSKDKANMSENKKGLFNRINDDLASNERRFSQILMDYEVVYDRAIYVFDNSVGCAEIDFCEEILNKYCPEYDMVELEYDSALARWEPEPKLADELLNSPQLEYVYQILTKEYYVDGIGNVTLDEVVVPATFNGIPVTKIRQFAFCKKHFNSSTKKDSTFNASSVIISNGITDIEKYAFHGCTSLEAVTIPKTVVNIGEFAFYGCEGLKTVNYEGSEEEWAQIAVSNSNDALNNATVNFNYIIGE